MSISRGPPSATSSDDAPPTTPRRAPCAAAALVSTGNASISLTPSPLPSGAKRIETTTTSASAAIWSTSAASCTEPWRNSRPGRAGATAGRFLVTEMTRCPRLSASSLIADPAYPVPPKIATVVIGPPQNVAREPVPSGLPNSQQSGTPGEYFRRPRRTPRCASPPLAQMPCDGRPKTGRSAPLTGVPRDYTLRGNHVRQCRTSFREDRFARGGEPYGSTSIASTAEHRAETPRPGARRGGSPPRAGGHAGSAVGTLSLWTPTSSARGSPRPPG